MKKAIVSALTLLLYFTAAPALFAQNVGINGNGSAPDASAMLDVKSADKGMLVPRVALTGTNDVATIPAPATSLLIYNTATVAGPNAISPGFYYWDGTAWTRMGTGVVANNAWAISGNTATPTDFIGTTNNEALRFKVNSVPAGIIESGIPFTTSFGLNALKDNTTGISNSAFGNDALFSNTTGGSNSAFGEDALYANTTGSSNSAFGEDALFLNTGDKNSAFGSDALRDNTVGGYNSAFGSDALRNNTTGDLNSAFGGEALYSNTAGILNSAFGEDALYFNTTGNYNSAFGNGALYSNSTGNYNSAFGNVALQTLSGNSSNNSGFGNNAFINDGASNATALGSNSSVMASNTVRIGNPSVTSIGGYAPWSNLSDERFKKNLEPLGHGLDFIMKLEPVTYHVDMQKLHNFKEQREGETEEPDPEWLAGAMAKKEAILYSGFSAQQVEAAAKAVGYDFSGVQKPANKLDHYSLAYAEFVVPLVKAVQEQQALIEKQQAENKRLKSMIGQQQKINEAQQAIIEKMQERMAKLEKG